MLGQSSVEMAALMEAPVDDAGDLAPGRQYCIGDHPHQTEMGASVHQTDRATRDRLAERGRRFGIRRRNPMI